MLRYYSANFEFMEDNVLAEKVQLQANWCVCFFPHANLNKTATFINNIIGDIKKQEK